MNEARAEMSMYAELLELALHALEEEHSGVAGPDLDAALAREIASRGEVLARLRPGADAADAIAAQVSYDAALLLLCRVLGVEVEPAWFARPKAARVALEDRLAARGVELQPPTATSTC
jgi:hypothetical protein